MKTLKLLFVCLLVLSFAAMAIAKPAMGMGKAPGKGKAAHAAVINVPDDYSNIQAAINAAAEGDTILIEADTYEENLTVNKSLTLKGAQAPYVTVDVDPDTGKALRAWPVKIEGYLNVTRCDSFNMYDLSVNSVGKGGNWGSDNTAVRFMYTAPIAADAIDVDLQDVQIIAEEGCFASYRSPLGNVSVTDCYMETEGDNDDGRPRGYAGTWGFGIMGLRTEGNITIERSTLKSSVSLFLTGAGGSYPFNGDIVCSDCDLVSIGYTKEKNSHGFVLMWGWEEDTTASGSFNDIRVFMHADDPPEGSTSSGIQIGYIQSLGGFMGYNAHNITFDDLNIVGEADYGILLEGTAHNNQITLYQGQIETLDVAEAHVYCARDTHDNKFKFFDVKRGDVKITDNGKDNENEFEWLTK